MANSYRLSERAREQILAIYEYTQETFGPYQADAYHSGLEHSFALLADFPKIGLDVESLSPRLRRFRFQSHAIFYTIESGHSILIRQILYVQMQVRPDLFS